MALFREPLLYSLRYWHRSGHPRICWRNPTSKYRVGSAIEAVEGACAADVGKFCGNVTRGEGRVLLCMQSYDDQLNPSCQFALYRASRNLERALDRVERIADACWTDIEAHCSDAEGIGRCVMDKGPALSPSCKTVVAGIRRPCKV